MTAMKQRAIELITSLPEDKVFYLVRFLEGLDGSQTGTAKVTDAQLAYQELQKYRRPGKADADGKAELRTAWERKFAGLD